MISATQILSHTPPWVFVLLAYLVWQGVRAMRPQTMTIWRLLIVPVVFIAMGLATIVVRHAGPQALLVWAAALAVLAPVGFVTSPALLAVDPLAKLVRRPGSVVPLVRNVGVFVLQYGFAVAGALHQDQGGLLFLAGRAVSGATAGYFLGYMLALRKHYRTAPRLARETRQSG